MRLASRVLGYHGCDREVAEAVLAGSATLKLSLNDYDWLGGGIYFWEESAQRALDWARLSQRHPQYSNAPVREPYVLGAIIDLGDCLSLLEAESIRLAQEAYTELAEIFDASGVPLPENGGGSPDHPLRRLDCAVINYLHHAREGRGARRFDSVRAAFVEGAPIYKGAGFHARTHIQLCIRDEAQIIGYFRVRELPELMAGGRR